VILTALKPGSFSRGGGDRKGVILAALLGIGVGEDDVVVVVVVVEAVEVDAEVGDGDVSEVSSASGPEEPEQPAVRSAAAQVTARTAFVIEEA
jgi:hypothetical protein